MQLIVCSKSTSRYIDDWEYNKILMIEDISKDILVFENAETNVIAIGGGSVIDAAKIISKNPIIAVPTTFAGASRTTHAVYWSENRKHNTICFKPTTIVRFDYLTDVPNDILEYSRIDAISHAVESLLSKKANTESIFYAKNALRLLNKRNVEDYLYGSLLAGDAIEITSTNIVHALSYPLTTMCDIPHREAVAYCLSSVLDYYKMPIPFGMSCATIEFDMEKVVDEALTYPKIFNSVLAINRKILMEMLQ